MLYFIIIFFLLFKMIRIFSWLFFFYSVRKLVMNNTDNLVVEKRLFQGQMGI